VFLLRSTKNALFMAQTPPFCKGTVVSRQLGLHAAQR
jgi:hypothetical protein